MLHVDRAPRSGLLERFLVATDGLPSGERAVSLAIALALRHAGSLELCYAVDRIPALGESYIGCGTDDTIVPYLASLDDAATHILRDALERVRGSGVTATAEILRGGPVSAVVDREMDRPFDALVMGTQAKHGLQRLLLGSTADDVLHRSTIPVFIAPETANAKSVAFERILVAVDGSHVSDGAVDFALDFAENEGARLVVCAVAASSDSHEAMATTVLAAPVARARSKGITCEAAVVWGDPGDQILKAAEAHDVDFIIVGTHGRRGFARWFFGSVAECVVEHSHVPVVVVRDDR
jgi:nucleotide-binding universal stress UspA family protein